PPYSSLAPRLLLIPPPPTSTLFPYTTLFRSPIPVCRRTSMSSPLMTVAGHVPPGHRPHHSRGFSRSSYVSITSPTLMSENLPSVRPHSKPSRTSTTSSLNLRSELTGRFSPTTTPSRSRRALELRRIAPDVTRQPAMVPTFE